MAVTLLDVLLSLVRIILFTDEVDDDEDDDEGEDEDEDEDVAVDVDVDNGDVDVDDVDNVDDDDFTKLALSSLLRSSLRRC